MRSKRISPLRFSLRLLRASRDVRGKIDGRHGTDFTHPCMCMHAPLLGSYTMGSAESNLTAQSAVPSHQIISSRNPVKASCLPFSRVKLGPRYRNINITSGCEDQYHLNNVIFTSASTSVAATPVRAHTGLSTRAAAHIRALQLGPRRKTFP
ncbi:hypothetical protein PUN28_010531 [Cardiocondyla obscurior]|uniref:Uncharacterized protein n=1 Tax=Cardiocondyla obscurior TaxID=286306 RepID=A0AAW2FJT7_9HYME